MNRPVFVLLPLLFFCCQVTKHLEDDQLLYTGAKVNFVKPGSFRSPKKVKGELLTLSDLKPNHTFKSWLYFAFRNPEKEGGLGNRISRRFGEPPSFYQDEAASRSVLRMEKYLRDRGHFNSEVEYDTVQHGREVEVIYEVSSSGRYRLRNVTFPPDTTSIGAFVQDHSEKTLLRKGKYYQVADLVGERARLTIEARNEGFFNFDEEDLFYFVDTNAVTATTNDSVDVWMQIKFPSGQNDFLRYHIGHTYIYPNYDLSRADLIRLRDTVRIEDLTILQNAEIIKPRTLKESIVQKEGDVFSEERQTATTNHFLDLDIYKFVNMKYRSRVADSLHFLDRYLYLTPGKVQNFSAEVGASTRPGSFGMSLRGTYSHKNIFHGAERFDFSTSTGFENGGKILISDDTLNNNLVEFSTRVDLTFPRFIFPFIRIQSGSSFHIPRTRIGLSASFQRRRKLFTLSSFRTTLGYDWDETRRKRHQVNLISVNYVKIGSRTMAFEQFLDENPVIARSFTDQFILGPSYTYTYTNQEVGIVKNYVFFLGQLETSGNFTYLVSKALGASDSKPFKLFGTEYSQFSKIDLDFRYYWVRRNSSLVARISPGVGIPYLNSEVMPYLKQYYVGGANSMRGFPIRGLLGSYHQDETAEAAVSAFDHTGEVKLELNAEYRFNLYSPFYLKGAAFVDVGNVWLLDPKNLEEDRRRVFSGDRFLKELAVSGGLGLRFDIQYIVLRFDTAIPLRIPFLPEDRRWTWDQLGQSGWIGRNLNFNIALGYPF